MIKRDREPIIGVRMGVPVMHSAFSSGRPGPGAEQVDVFRALPGANRRRPRLSTPGRSPEDWVIRRVALRGSATLGIALSRADLVPEITPQSAG